MAFDRSIARESKIWTPFIYSFPFEATQITDRATIFGLYSSAYLNRNKYLLEIETEDLANLLDDYNSKMADLTNQEAIVVQNIVSRRYIASIDTVIHDLNLATQSSQNDAKSNEWDAKFDALSVDEAELSTLATKAADAIAEHQARLAALDVDRAALNTLTSKVTSETLEYQARLSALSADEAMESTLSAQVNSRQQEHFAKLASLAADGAAVNTLASKVNSENLEYQARLAALSADQAVLETMAARVTSEIEKTNAKITEIEAYIEMESVHLDMADIEIAEKEIQSSKVDLQKLDVTNDIIKIQIDTVKTAQGLIDIDLKIARAKVDKAQIDRNINSIDLLDSEWAIEKARTQIAEAERDVADARATFAESRTTEAQAEIDYYTGTLTEQAEERTTKKIELMDLRQAGLDSDLGMRRSEKDLANALRKDEVNMELYMAIDDSAAQVAVDANKMNVAYQRSFNIDAENRAKIEATEIMATAEIGTTLTHTIAKATTT